MAYRSHQAAKHDALVVRSISRRRVTWLLAPGTTSEEPELRPDLLRSESGRVAELGFTEERHVVPSDGYMAHRKMLVR